MPSPQGRRSVLLNLLISLRPGQWTKNLFVFAALVFAQRLGDTDAVMKAVIAFFVFCALSSTVYLINDVLDREQDRRHPLKTHRPIASGALGPPLALAAAAVVGIAAMIAAWTLGRQFFQTAAAYVVLLIAYSAFLKHIVILDVLTIAIGFVLRTFGGAVVIDVHFSNWLLLLTLLGALFLGLSKRRAELVALASGASDHRRSLAEYSPYLLDQMISVVTSSTLVAYAFYTISPETVQRFGTEHLLLTMPFPLYGIFRYLYLVHQREGGGDPSEMLLTDRPLLLCVAAWGLAVIAILYGPWR
jgi:4-hydroxybenzoate polyprenyltransferase